MKKLIQYREYLNSISRYFIIYPINQNEKSYNYYNIE